MNLLWWPPDTMTAPGSSKQDQPGGSGTQYLTGLIILDFSLLLLNIVKLSLLIYITFWHQFFASFIDCHFYSYCYYYFYFAFCKKRVGRTILSIWEIKKRKNIPIWITNKNMKQRDKEEQLMLLQSCKRNNCFGSNKFNIANNLIVY